MNRKKIIGENSGSAMLTVIIAILFIVALGVALLSASYMGYTVTLAQKNDKANFYSASEAMDQIRAGLHGSVSDALSDAYTETLKQYANKSASNEAFDAQTTFANNFYANLKAVKGSDSTALFTLTGSDVSGYQPAVLKEYVTSSGGTLTVTGNNAVLSKNGSGVPQSVTLQGITVDYINEKNYESVVSSDIAIKIPTFSVAATLAPNLNNYTIIANSLLQKESSSGPSAISGDVWAGEVKNDSASDSVNASLIFKNGNLVCAGDLTTATGAFTSFSAVSNELWAKRINLSGDSSKIDVKGSTYVANDLVLGGAGSSAVLSGSYFGFGNSLANTTALNSSSSIVVNGKKCTLDLSGLNKLTLAGVNFINPSSTNDETGGSKTAIPMGQSIGVKSDQLAYLAPPECLGSDFATNPCVFDSSGAVPAVNVKYTRVIMSGTDSNGNAVTKTLADYIGSENATGSAKKGEIKVTTVPLTNTQSAAYAFIVFSNQTAANNYFKDYFTYHSSYVGQYLSNYLSADSKLTLKTGSSAAGGTYYYDKNDKLQFRPADYIGQTAGLQDKTSLPSPYYSLVNTTNLSSLSSTPSTFTYTSADNSLTLKAVVINDTTGNDTVSYTFDGSDSSIHLIISNGTVAVTGAFQGIILANKILLGQNGSVSSYWNSKILEAKNSSGDSLSKYFGTESGSGENSWNIDDLVVYENWKKS